MFFVEYDGIFGKGSTLKDALQDFEDGYGNGAPFNELSFYEGSTIEVEKKIEKKSIPVKKTINKA